MFFFKRSKKQKYLDFSVIGVDMHSHLIPAVDDGAKDIADSLALIEGLKALGFHHLITTPHTFQDIHPNTKVSLEDGHKLLTGHLPDGIGLALSSEYYLDDQFKEQLDLEAILPLPGNRLLVECSQLVKPHDLEERIFDLGIRGYQVILAHPERYLFFHEDFAYFTRLKEMGVEMQVNALSLTPHYGKHVQAIAEKLITKDLIDFIGTDLHHAKHLAALQQVPVSKYFTRLVDSGLLKNQSLLV